MDFEEKLIYAVKKRDELYNPNHRNYKKNFRRTELWHEIAKELNVEVEQCQKRWKSLKRRYANEYYNKKILTAAGLKLKKKWWAYFNMLEFLNPFLKKEFIKSTKYATSGNEIPTKITIKTASKIASPRNLQSNHCSSCHAQKRLRNANLIDKKYIKSEHDNVDAFLMNLGPVLKSFDLITRLQVEIDLNKIILTKLKEKR